MNIGIDARNTGKKRTGIGIYIEKIVEELNKSDKENNYYLYSDGEIDFDFKLNNNFKKIENIGSKLKFYFGMPKLIQKDKLDVYWGTHYILPKKTKNVRFILTIHDLAIIKLKTVGSYKTTLMQKLFWKRSVKRADEIITISEATKKDIIEIYDIPNDKINVTYPGTNFEKQTNTIEKKEIEEIEKKYKIKNTPFLFFLSTIEPRKNIETLIKAFDYIKENEKLNLKLIIAGGLGWKYANVLKLYEESKYKDDIIMPGYITKKEKQYFYDNAICFVYPSLYEGFGLPILEAMAYKTLVITANNSSLPEAGGNAAFYYENTLDEKALGEKILEVMNLSEEEKENKKQKGLVQVNKFTWKECAEKNFKILSIGGSYEHRN